MMRLLNIALVLLTLPLRAAMTVPDSLAKLGAVSPFPTVVAAARANQIPLLSFDAPSVSDSKVVPGDSVTALVTVSQKGAMRTQWLLYLQVVEPGPNDKVEKSPVPAARSPNPGRTENRRRFRIKSPASPWIKASLASALIAPPPLFTGRFKPARPEDLISATSRSARHKPSKAGCWRKPSI
jgi:hypothetical protein